ncbi:MAG: flavin-containing monooxygenase [Pseudomonadales bacterium]
MVHLTKRDLMVEAATWLESFEKALTAGSATDLATLFVGESFWRDAVAFSQSISTTRNAQAIAAQLAELARTIKPRNFSINPSRTAPRVVHCANTECLEAIFSFDTAAGRGEGVLRLVPDDAHSKNSALKSWTLLTALDSLNGHEESLGKARPSGEAYSRDFCGPNWLDFREKSRRYEDRDPAVLVVGGGQAGLTISARLVQLGVDTLVIDRHKRIGDNWRKRYHALTLHNQLHVNHLPYMPFPPSWPTYIPKDKLANWFEAYAESMEINYWPATELVSGEYDSEAGHWVVTVKDAADNVREMRPRHVVMATGVSDIPQVPNIPGLENFSGSAIHSSAYTTADQWVGKRALVIGTGNSGHDIAQDLHSNGVAVTLVQRSPTLVVNVEPSAQLPYALYGEGTPLEDCDLITTAMPFELARRAHVALTNTAKKMDEALLSRLESRGFKLDFGDDGSGWQFKYLSRGGGYYFNVGCSDLIADGEIGLVQWADIETIGEEGALLKSGDKVDADLIVLATGFKGPSELVRHLFGPEVCDRVGPIWGFGDDDELRNMFTKTPQPGLWFIAGSLAQCRIFSKYLALQIRMAESGL